MYQKSFRQWFHHMDVILLDLFSLFAGLILAYRIRRPLEGIFFSHLSYVRLLGSLLVIDFVVLLLLGTMNGVMRRGYLVEALSTLRNGVVVYAVETLVLFGLQNGMTYSRITFFLSAILYCIITYVLRVIYKRISRKYIIPVRGRSLLVITDRMTLREVNRFARERYFEGYRVAGVIVENIPDGEVRCSLPLLTGVEDVEEWVRLNWVDEVLILLPPDEKSERYAETFTSMGITVHMGIYHVMGMLPNGRQRIERTCGFDVVTVYWKSMTAGEAALKRAFDIFGAVIGCLITAVLTVFIAPAIKLSSPGPVFFKQERIGRNGKHFCIYKFRSMYADAEERKRDYIDQNRIGDGRMFKLDWDPRVIGNVIGKDGRQKTGLGEFLRKTSLDEFPQFFNVLKGDMSLVGTRPPTPDEWALYEDRHRARLAMRPGITGLWQVSGRSKITDFEEVVKLDKKYIADWSPMLDIKILLKTVGVVLRRDGSM